MMVGVRLRDWDTAEVVVPAMEEGETAVPTWGSLLGNIWLHRQTVVTGVGETQ